jgi:putative flippase GtrA
MAESRIRRLILDRNDSTGIKFLRFLIAGAAVVLLDTLTFFFLAAVLKINYLIANSISFIISTTFEYFITRQWVFNRQSHRIIKDYTLFILTGLSCLLISNLTLFILVDKKILLLLFSGLRPDIVLLMAKAVAVTLSAFVDFWLKKTIVFRQVKLSKTTGRNKIKSSKESRNLYHEKHTSQ